MGSLQKALGVAILLFLLICNANAGPGTSKPLPEDVLQLSYLSAELKLKIKPDLSAEIKLEIFNGISGGKEVFSVQPIYSVRNNGSIPAKDFKVKLEWRSPSQTHWQMHSEKNIKSLNGGESLSWGPSPFEGLAWEPGDQGKVGFRFTVDSDDTVVEEEENNNTAEALFPVGGSGQISIHSPIGHVEWLMGSQQKIKWTATGVTKRMKITLWQENNYIGVIANNIIPPPPQVLSAELTHAWKVGDYQGGTAEPGQNYWIKIETEGIQEQQAIEPKTEKASTWKYFTIKEMVLKGFPKARFFDVKVDIIQIVNSEFGGPYFQTSTNGQPMGIYWMGYNPAKNNIIYLPISIAGVFSVKTPPKSEITEADVSKWGSGKWEYSAEISVFSPEGPSLHKNEVRASIPAFTWQEVANWPEAGQTFKILFSAGPPSWSPKGDLIKDLLYQKFPVRVRSDTKDEIPELNEDNNNNQNFPYVVFFDITNPPEHLVEWDPKTESEPPNLVVMAGGKKEQMKKGKFFSPPRPHIKAPINGKTYAADVNFDIVTPVIAGWPKATSLSLEFQYFKEPGPEPGSIGGWFDKTVISDLKNLPHPILEGTLPGYHFLPKGLWRLRACSMADVGFPSPWSDWRYFSVLSEKEETAVTGTKLEPATSFGMQPPIEGISKDAAPGDLKIQHRLELLNPADGSTYTERLSGKCKVELKVGTPQWMPFHVTVHEVLPKGKTRARSPAAVDAAWGSQSPGAADSRWTHEESGRWVYTDLVLLDWGKTYKMEITPKTTGKLQDRMAMGKTTATFKTISLAMRNNLDSLTGRAAEKACAPMTALTLLNRKPFYVPGESVRIAVQGETQAEPEVKCSPDGVRWGSDCPGVTLRKMGNQWMVQAGAPGKYAFVLENASEQFEVKGAAGPAAAIPGAIPSSSSSSTQPASGTTQTIKVPAAVSRPPAAPVPTAPIRLSLASRAFIAPAGVKIVVWHDTHFEALYKLKQTSGGSFKSEGKISGDLQFNNLPPGGYELEAYYTKGGPGSKITWTVQPPVQRLPEPTQPQAPSRSSTRRAQ